MLLKHNIDLNKARLLPLPGGSAGFLSFLGVLNVETYTEEAILKSLGVLSLRVPAKVLYIMEPIAARMGFRHEINKKSAPTFLFYLITGYYEYLTNHEKGRLRRILTLLRMVEVADILEGIDDSKIKDQKYQCPRTHVPVHSACGVKDCAFWFENLESHAKCLGILSEGEPLNPTKIGRVLGKTSSEVAAILKEGMLKMRRHILNVEMSEASIKPDFRVFKNAAVCVVCSCLVPVNDNGSLKPVYHDHGFSVCSVVCFQKRPIEDVMIECRFGISIKNVVIWAAESFTTIEAIAGALHLTKPTTVHLLERHGALIREPKNKPNQEKTK